MRTRATTLATHPGTPRLTAATRMGWVAMTSTRARKTGPTISERPRRPETTRKPAARLTRSTAGRGSPGGVAAADAGVTTTSGASAYEQVRAAGGGAELGVVVLVDAHSAVLDQQLDEAQEVEGVELEGSAQVLVRRETLDVCVRDDSPHGPRDHATC